MRLVAAEPPPHNPVGPGFGQGESGALPHSAFPLSHIPMFPVSHSNPEHGLLSLASCISCQFCRNASGVGQRPEGQRGRRSRSDAGKDRMNRMDRMESSAWLKACVENCVAGIHAHAPSLPSPSSPSPLRRQRRHSYQTGASEERAPPWVHAHKTDLLSAESAIHLIPVWQAANSRAGSLAHRSHSVATLAE